MRAFELTSVGRHDGTNLRIESQIQSKSIKASILLFVMHPVYCGVLGYYAGHFEEIIQGRIEKIFFYARTWLSSNVVVWSATRR